MKKLMLLTTGLMLMMVIVSVSCKKDSESNPQDNPPSIKLNSGTGYISANATVKINDSIKFGIRATPNSSTGAKITTLYFARNFNGLKSDTSYTMPGNNVDLLTKANSQVGSETFTLTVKDEKGATASVQVVLTTITPTLKKGEDAMVPASDNNAFPISIREVR